jgi:hypothetical protein
LGVAAQQRVFLDVPEFAAAARALGMRAITFASNEQAVAQLEQLLDVKR